MSADGAPAGPEVDTGAMAATDLAALCGIELSDAVAQSIGPWPSGRLASPAQLRSELARIGIETSEISASYDELIALDRPLIAQLVIDDAAGFVAVERVTAE